MSNPNLGKVSKFEELPQRIFLGTNIINLLVKHSDEVFEMVPPPSGCFLDTHDTMIALRMLFFVMRRAPWDLRISRETVLELDETRDDSLREQLTSYGREFLHFSYEEDLNWASDLARRIHGTKFLSALPHASDRELLANAIALGCDTFCTLDIRSIHKKRDKLGLLPIRILTPKEWWNLVKPWAGLYI